MLTGDQFGKVKNLIQSQKTLKPNKQKIIWINLSEENHSAFLHNNVFCLRKYRKTEQSLGD